MTRFARSASRFFLPFALAVVGALLVVFSTALADSRGKGPTPDRFLVEDGRLTLDFDPAALAELGLRIVAHGHEEFVSTENSLTFALDPSSVLEWRVESDGVTTLSTVGLATCGALLLDRPGERVVLTDLTLRADAEGAMTLHTTFDDGPDGRPVFDLSDIWVDARRRGPGLRLSAEISLSQAAAERWFDRDDAGMTLGGVTLVAELAASDRVVSFDATCRGGTPASDAGVSLGSAASIGPDVLVADLQTTVRFSRVGDITAFGIGTTSCNIGTERVSWAQYTNQHPVIMQNLFRLRDDRLEQIGMAWIKHGFFAVSQGLCSPCNDPTNGTELGVGCSDPYSASLNGVQTNMSPRAAVNAHTGYFPYPWNGPAPGNTIERRLQVRDHDLDPARNPGARYFIEGHYVTSEDAAAGTHDNNASYREVTVAVTGPSVYNLIVSSSWPTVRGRPAVRAWHDVDPGVVETDVRVPGEGLFILAARSSSLGEGTYRYTYALHNLNSDRSARSFAVALPTGAVLENIAFRDIDSHSGEPFSTADWTALIADGYITWATDSFEVDRNANALRFATAYAFSFDANVEPDAGKALIGLFKPGGPTEVPANTVAPRLALIDCNRNLIADVCDIDCSAPGCVPPCGLVPDCNENRVPDDCEPDCNGNGVADGCDIADCPPGDLSCTDCNANVVPDECEADCDGNGIPDDCVPPGDADGDGLVDCLDLCPASTPPGACQCPYWDQCCFSNGFCILSYPRDSCLELGGTPDCLEVPCRDGCLLGDWTGDGDLDADDFCGLQNCYSASHDTTAFAPPPQECLSRFDFDDDQDIDLNDYGFFHDLRKGPRR